MFQSALDLLYPRRCVTCDNDTQDIDALCGECWSKTPFLGGALCDKCGINLPGDEEDSILCDDCLTVARPWLQGRAALRYTDNARKLILRLKHGDRSDLARPAGQWMARAAAPILQPDMMLAPVPLHWRRFLSRTYNQSAELAKSVALATDLPVLLDALERRKPTVVLDGLNRDERFQAVSDCIGVTAKHAAKIQGRHMLLIDDVMTSGATLAASASACLDAGAKEISVVTLARVGKEA
ncbi:ComF family protein [Algirhabdus cladophorae]|uniref:ComF family protein n=1 Tax=Algirhabdus cladophorae TaxID=3377108 RepID=UPI003B845A36